MALLCYTYENNERNERRIDATKEEHTLDLHILIIENTGSKYWDEVKLYFQKKKRITVYVTSVMGDAFRIMQLYPVNVIISEYQLPRINILNFLKKVKNLKPHIEVIFLAEKVVLSKAIEAMKAGAYDIYEFPVNMRLLMTMVEKAIEKQALFFEKEELKMRVKERFDFSNIIGRSKLIQNVMNIVSSVAPKNVNVLLNGETGTGKEMIAEAIHYNSPRASRQLIKVNCAAFNVGVLESELFGHEKGAFTGAIASRIGRFEIANGGTIFLDEIGDISHSTQIKLLRVLQEKEFERVGGNDTIKVDVRIIAASNKDLKGLVEKGKFRKDLYYRLNVVNIDLPPLRDRKEDIPVLVSHFITRLNEEKDYRINGITKGAMQILLGYRWPGNVRELENTIESAMALAEKDIVEEKYLPSFLLLSPSLDGTYYHIPRDMTLNEIEKEIIRNTLKRTGGNKTKASRLLGIGLRTLQRKAKEI